ncbi:hypothetical protein PFISCL1PPCAC_2812, partial [Pristionchus fissidentatus]
VCELERDPDSRVYFDSNRSVPFLINGNQFVAYENPRSIRSKTTWASMERLGGIAVFDAQLDNPKGLCPQQPFPLLSAMADAQVCHSCVQKDEVFRCDPLFTVSCSYRLPTAHEPSPMSIDKISFDPCDQIVVEEVFLTDSG